MHRLQEGEEGDIRCGRVPLSLQIPDDDVGDAEPAKDGERGCGVGALVEAPHEALALGDLRFDEPVEAHLWMVLLALSSQVGGWLLITISLPRLPAVVTSILLTLQPVGSVLFAALLIAERPSALQLAGTAAILAGLVIASASRRQRPTTEQVAEAPAG